MDVLSVSCAQISCVHLSLVAFSILQAVVEGEKWPYLTLLILTLSHGPFPTGPGQ